MTSYERLFGAGPRGFLISLLLLAAAVKLEALAGLPRITESSAIKYAVFVLLSLAAIGVLAWSIASLPPSVRGKKLVQEGAFKYFRHPLYGAFLSFFNFGFAVLLNNWIYLIWAVTLHPLWHWNIRREEKLMYEEFPDEYLAYCSRTWRFFPKIT